MENTVIPVYKRTLTALLFGVIVLISSGTALAATKPNVKDLSFTYTVTNADGSTSTHTNTITTGYEANRVAVDSKGNIYVTDAVSNTVSVYNTNGLLTNQMNINRALAIGIDKDSFKYISGAPGDESGVYIFDNDNNGMGPLGSGWGQPMDIAVFDRTDGSGYTDVYVADSYFDLVRKITLKSEVDATTGKISKKQIESKDYGPYGGEKYATESFYSVSYSRTRHKMVFPRGVAVDGANGLIYLSIMETVDYLAQSCANQSGGGGKDTNCYLDTEESYKYYNDGNTTDGSKIATDSTYIYWNNIGVSATQYHVLIIDANTGALKTDKIAAGKITVGGGSDYASQPRGLALDGKDRLYVATRAGSMTGGGALKIYDASSGTELTPASGSFVSAVYSDVVFSPGSNYDSSSTVTEANGWMFATVGDSKIVSSWIIDSGANSSNTAPNPPTLYDPDPNTKDAVVSTTTPTLKVINATDPENDPLTYGYEVYEIDKTTRAKIGDSITPAGLFAEGKEEIASGDSKGKKTTSMPMTAELKEDSLYSWKAQSFDGVNSSWSSEATFCVDTINSSPAQPAITAPLNNAVVSPFSSVLSWDPSTDPDCTNDTLTYEVTVLDGQGNALKSLSGLNSTSVNLSEIFGLISGNTYQWQVRAVDNRGGKSDYGSGSFVYMTTTVSLDSDQADTKVYMDGNYGYYGKLLGTTPVLKSDIVPGSHFVAFVKAGYEPSYTLITVSDPAADSTKSSAAYTANMTTSSRISPPASATSTLFTLGSGNSSPFVVDYDKDGLKDVVAGGNDGKVYLYRSERETQSDGTEKIVLVSKGALKDSSGSDISAGSRLAPFVVDYDDDGYQDLLLGSGDGYVYLYKGAKDGFVSSGALALKDENGNDLNASLSNLAPVVVDYDNDGKKDLVIGSSDGALRRYANTGSDESPLFGAPSKITADGGDLKVASNSKAFFVDWNSDGKKDLIVGDGTGNVSLFFNVGTDETPDFKSISGLQDWIKEKKEERGNKEYADYLGYTKDIGDLTGSLGEASPFVVDWDGSSARDVAVGNGSGSVAAYITETE